MAVFEGRFYIIGGETKLLIFVIYRIFDWRTKSTGKLIPLCISPEEFHNKLLPRHENQHAQWIEGEHVSTGKVNCDSPVSASH